VWVPDAGHEAMRDLVRAVGCGACLAPGAPAALRVLAAAGMPIWASAWTKLHRVGWPGFRFEHAVHHIVLEDYIAGVEAAGLDAIG